MGGKLGFVGVESLFDSFCFCRYSCLEIPGEIRFGKAQLSDMNPHPHYPATTDEEGGMLVLKIGICDDSLQDRTIFVTTLKNLDFYRREQNVRVFQYTSAQQLLFQIEDDVNLLDFLFLDVVMPEMNGIEAARRVRELGIKIPIVFFTTSPEFALESYEVEAFGYLLKPVNSSKLETLMGKYTTLRQSKKYYVYRKGNALRRVLYEDIVYIESSNHFLLLHLSNGEQLEEPGRLNDLEQYLADERFLRTHQSYLVNMCHIVKAGDAFVMDNGQEVLVRKKDRKAICDKYHQWLIGETFC